MAVQGDFTAADEMFEAIRRLRSDPASMLPALGWSLLVDVAGAVTLWAVLHAFGEPAGVVVVVNACGVSMLFALMGFLPGGLGFAEMFLAGVLIGSGISVPVAAAIAVADRAIEAWYGLALLISVRGLATRMDRRTRHDWRKCCHPPCRPRRSPRDIVVVAAATASIIRKGSFIAHTDPFSSKAAVDWLTLRSEITTGRTAPPTGNECGRW